MKNQRKQLNLLLSVIAKTAAYNDLGVLDLMYGLIGNESDSSSVFETVKESILQEFTAIGGDLGDGDDVFFQVLEIMVNDLDNGEVTFLSAEDEEDTDEDEEDLEGDEGEFDDGADDNGSDDLGGIVSEPPVEDSEDPDDTKW